MYMCEHIGPPHSCAVMPWGGGGGYCTLSLAGEGAVMMPLHGGGFFKVGPNWQKCAMFHKARRFCQGSLFWFTLMYSVYYT